jgi:predicted dehydrogenase
MHAAKGVEIVAVGDYFRDKAIGLGKQHGVPAERCFGGLDAYKEVIATPGVNYVILATSPGFRPQHLQAAVDAGKHIFTEKPVGVDGPGIRKVLDAYEAAQKKNLCIVAGTQRRHQHGYLETMKRIKEGAIGDIVSARAYWNGGNIWFRQRKEGMSDLDYQINNWYHFLWVCGDHIVEQHVHNLDVVNWAKGAHPVRAVAMGGRVRPYSDPNKDGNIFNYFAVDYTYADGTHMLSMCRQVDGTAGNISEALVGTKGNCQVNEYKINGQVVVTRNADRQAGDPYVQEHTDLIAAIRGGKKLNELKDVAESTLTAILGRNAAYTGKEVTWDDTLRSMTDTMPANLGPQATLPVTPLPVPGKTQIG